ncbi:MAG TPA: carboxylesterase family protein [Syntrophales bacterium]|nr:carboxylesterase family protein [Syntrophales bacterium]HPO35337.1 carboxylesterase family protein [Syntrophales bacterium]
MCRFGRVSGYADTDYDVWIWKGIPYAKAPVGSLRWKAPQDPDTWTGTREATDNCDVCIQQVYNQYWMSSNAFVGSEDCLYLDIYRPKTSDTNLPVFVWIHGGSNNFGSARQYNGSALARRGNMIVVIVQYRLNAMGFLTHPSLRQSGTDADKSGNYGTLDQIKALTWVKNNIASFGGDPNKVVVGGQSAGAHNTMNLIISPLAQGLFRGALVMSAAMNIYSQASADAMTDTTIKGLLIRTGRASNATEAAQVLAGMTNAEIEAFLRSQPAELVVRCRRDGMGADGTGSMTTHSAIKDGTVIKHSSWLEAIGAGEYNKVPVMIGSTEYEWKDFQGLYGALVKLYSGNKVPSSQYTWFDAYKVIGVGGNLALTDVLPTQRDQDIYTSVATLRSRLWKVTGVDQIARALKTNDASNGVWAYLFKWAGGGDPALANFKFLFGAAHAMEIPFFFGYPTDAWNYSFTSANKTGREALQLAMMDYLIAFVKNLNPNPTGSSLPTWSEWNNTAGANKYISFDADLTNYIIQSSVYEETLSAVQADVATAKALYPEAAYVYTMFGM